MKQHYAPPRNNDNHHFNTRVKNLTNTRLNEEELHLLRYGLNYSVERPTATHVANLIAETERAKWHLDVKVQNTYLLMATNKLKHIINSPSQTSLLQITPAQRT